jgi:glycosyltransferase involved in cell wall biosynthesis
MPERKRIVLVVNEILGLVRTGGAGTANTFLSFALAGMGHDVKILFTDLSIPAELDPLWAGEYADRGIVVQALEPPRERIVPRGLTVTYAVQQALQDDAPDVVVAGDWSGPAYAALRSRQLGLGFSDMLFVVYCHGTNGWVYEAHRKPARSVGSFELEALERASVELADVVVSPSAYMLDWMHGRGWQVSHSVVAPYFTRSSVDGTSVEKVALANTVRRLAFFGRLEERKGIAPFVEALNALDASVLTGIELVFLGRETPRWPAQRVAETLSEAVRTHVAALRFETNLDQPAAIATLEQPGTLAVMPSLLDNSPNVIYECLEHGIPFLAGDRGGGPELVAAEDRLRTFVEPTPDGIRAGLEDVLAIPGSLRPARPSFDPDRLRAIWEDLATVRPVAREPAEVSKASDFVLLRNQADELDPDGLETLQHAQAASGADVVTCGVRGRLGRTEEIRLFLGEPRELGVVANYYGLLGLYRRSLLEQAEQTESEGEGDDDWLRLARLSLAGARIVSVPRPLGRSERSPGSAATDPVGSGVALAVVQAFERACPPELQILPRLAAGLAARREEPPRSPSIIERARWIWEHEGAAGLVRRAKARTSPALRRTGLYARRLSSTGLLRRAHGPGSERGPIRPAEGTDESYDEQDNGHGKRNAELPRVAPRPRTLAEGVIRERDEPQQREARLREHERHEQQQEVVHPDDR